MSNGKQTEGNWNLDASQIEQNLKSTAKSKKGFHQNKHMGGTIGSGAQNQNYMLNVSQEEANPFAASASNHYIEVQNQEKRDQESKKF